MTEGWSSRRRLLLLFNGFFSRQRILLLRLGLFQLGLVEAGDLLEIWLVRHDCEVSKLD